MRPVIGLKHALCKKPSTLTPRNILCIPTVDRFFRHFNWCRQSFTRYNRCSQETRWPVADFRESPTITPAALAHPPRAVVRPFFLLQPSTPSDHHSVSPKHCELILLELFPLKLTRITYVNIEKTQFCCKGTYSQVMFSCHFFWTQCSNDLADADGRIPRLFWAELSEGGSDDHRVRVSCPLPKDVDLTRFEMSLRVVG